MGKKDVVVVVVFAGILPFLISCIPLRQLETTAGEFWCLCL